VIKNASLLAVAIGALLASAAAAQAPVPPMPADVQPLRASGLGLTVSNLERSMKFYTEVLGFKVDAKVPATGGPVQEYLLGYTGNTQADTLVVLRQGAVVPGATSFGRIVVVAPNGRKLAERVQAAGYPLARIVDGTNIIKDPDGYTIELYQRPAAPAR
jgi:catechol 2,3-dioxygenase-like lactoylglutathione lyase family enzyme